jgi:hypothetical protein
MNISFCCYEMARILFLLSFLKASTLNTGRCRSHDPQLQSPRGQAETIPLDHASMPGRGTYMIISEHQFANWLLRKPASQK